MPIQENEVVMLALGIGVFCFGYASRSSLMRIPDWPLLGLAYVVLLVAWTARNSTSGRRRSSRP